jgi:hypothetical protein
MSGRVWPLSLQAPLPLGRLRSPIGRLGHDDHRTPTILPPMRDTPVAEGGSVGWRHSARPGSDDCHGAHQAGDRELQGEAHRGVPSPRHRIVSAELESTHILALTNKPRQEPKGRVVFDHPDTDCPKYCRPLYLLTPLFLLVPGSLYFRGYPGAFSMKQKQPPRQRKIGRRSKTTRRTTPRMTAEDAMQELYSEEWFQALIEREVARRMNGESDALPVLSAAVASESPRRSARPGRAGCESPESDRVRQTRTDSGGVHDPV